MAHGGGEDEGRLDLVPMIDCIMLLLLFFMMTTKFSSEEKAISSLLPTDKGQGAASATKVDPPQMVNICIYPAGMQKGYQPSEYAGQLDRIRTPGQVIQAAYLRIGGRDPMEIDGNLLRTKNSKQMENLVEEIHAYVESELSKYEQAGKDRKGQNDIVIHCFSGLSWKYALLSYDAVRSYEAKVGQIKWTGNPDELLAARAVNFAPPRIRNYSADDLGSELYEIIHMK
jgi:hypothetical protein